MEGVVGGGLRLKVVTILKKNNLKKKLKCQKKLASHQEFLQPVYQPPSQSIFNHFGAKTAISETNIVSLHFLIDFFCNILLVFLNFWLCKLGVMGGFKNTHILSLKLLDTNKIAHILWQFIVMGQGTHRQTDRKTLRLLDWINLGANSVKNKIIFFYFYVEICHNIAVWLTFFKPPLRCNFHCRGL